MGVITERQWRYIQMQMGPWRKHEPEQYNISTHMPRITRQIAERAVGEDLNIERLRAMTHLKAELLTDFFSLHSERAVTKQKRAQNVLEFT